MSQTNKPEEQQEDIFTDILFEMCDVVVILDEEE